MPEKYFLIDNNFLRRITRKDNDQIIYNWWVDLEANKISKGGSTIQMVVTPFVLLEAVGIKLSSTAPKLDEASFDGKDIADVGSLVYEHGYKYFKELAELSATNIQAKLEEARTYCSNDGLTLFNAVIHRNIDDPDFTNDICQNLALDYLLQNQYPAAIAPQLHQVFWLALNDTLQKGGNLSFYRVIKRMWEQLPQKGREALFGGEQFGQLSKSFRMDSKEDFVDTELIHFAVIGKSFSGKREAIEIFTMDAEQTVRDRISLYKAVLRVIRERFDENKLPTEAFQKFKPGKVHIYGQDGKRIAEIDASRVPELEA